MRVRWTATAAGDLTSICDYTQEQHGPEGARKLALRIYESAASLSQFPYRGRKGRKSGTRELIFSVIPFLAVYRIPRDVVEIVRILRGAQRWPLAPPLLGTAVFFSTMIVPK
jgi:plasmid stabilization system protein ParE